MLSMTLGSEELHNLYKLPLEPQISHHNLYCSPNTIRVIKLWTVRWIGHVPCMGEMRSPYKIFV